MTRFKLCIALSVLLASGCAGAPKVADEAAPPVAVAPTTPAVESAAPASSSLDGVLVVDVNDLVASTPPPLICRQMLQQNSNVIITRCLTEKAWKRFYRQESLQAQETVRALQGGHYH